MTQAANQSSGTLRDKKVCVTGRLIAMTHGELRELVESHGGEFLRSPRRCGFTLVIGDDGWPTDDDGRPTQVFNRARKLRARGYPIEFTSEDEFLSSLGLTEPADAIRGRHTISDLVRILEVPATSIRRWVRSGLIEPVDSDCRLHYFDFNQVSNAKRICELLDSGVSLAKIRDGVEQVRQWLPDSRLPLAALSKLEGKTAVFRRGADLLDRRGQRYFDFETSVDSTTTIAQPLNFAADEVSDLFDQALELEDAGQLSDAANVYQRAINVEPDDPILHFNLGNVLYGLDRFEQSAASFQQALRHDSNYAEAWNNLGNVLTALERLDEAAEAFHRALRLVPTYADAHYNLADVLDRLGQSREADHHRAAYRKHSSAEALSANRVSFLRVISDDQFSDGSS